MFFPDENVLAAGGFVSNAGWPIIDWWTGGWTVGMLNGFDRLLEVANERTRIVPAVGPVMSLAELKAQHAMYLTVFERIHGLLIKALGVDEVLGREADGRVRRAVRRSDAVRDAGVREHLGPLAGRA